MPLSFWVNFGLASPAWAPLPQEEKFLLVLQPIFNGAECMNVSKALQVNRHLSMRTDKPYILRNIIKESN